MTDGVVVVERRGGVVDVTLNRPDKLNAMTDAMWAELADILDSVSGDDRVLVVRGAGGNFCAGSDVADLPVGPVDRAWMSDRIALSNRCVQRVYDLDIPTVAVFTGVAAGSGLNFGLACDFVLAAADARIIQVFIRRGLSLDSGASWLLPRLVGERRARQLALLGEALDADTAAEWGLVTAAYPLSTLDDEVNALVQRLEKLAPQAVCGTKHLLAQSWQHDLTAALTAETDNQVEVLAGPDAQAALARFGERR